MNTLTIQGVIDKDGNLKIHDKAKMNHFVHRHKGAAVILVLDVIGDNITEAQKGYYYKKIVPDFQAAWYELGERYTLEETERRLREMSHRRSDFEIEDLDKQQMSDYISELVQIGAEHFGIEIKSSDELFNY